MNWFSDLSAMGTTSVDFRQGYRTFACCLLTARELFCPSAGYELRITWDVRPRTRTTLSEKVEDGAAVLKTKATQHIYSHCSLFQPGTLTA
jgi:hypothetical protein